MSNLYQLDIARLSAYLNARDWDGCWSYLYSILSKMHGTGIDQRLKKKLETDFESPEKNSELMEFSKLFSQFLIVLLKGEHTELSDKNFYKMLVHHETIHTLFYIGGITSAEPILKEMLEQIPGKMSPDKQKQLLLLIPLDTNLDIANILKKTMRRYYVPAALALLSYIKVYETNAHDNKVKLLPLAEHIVKMNFDMLIANLALTAFFRVSYIDHPDKHNVKASINRFIKSANKIILKGVDQKLRTKASPQRDKPLLLFQAEYFQRGHAMYRSWHRRAQALKNKFDLVLLIEKHSVDKNQYSDYDNIREFDPSNMRGAYETIMEMAPDIIFYPSIGMTAPTLIFSNYRFAPLQIMGLGHPATAMNPNIDFVIGHEELYTAQGFPRDHYLMDRMPSVFSKHPALEELDLNIPEKAQPKDTISVGIAGTTFKFIAPFLKMLKELETESKYDLHINFLVAGEGLDYIYIHQYLEQNFKQHTMYGNQLYARYLNCLKDVDIVLNPFPFGHSNTLADTLLCGKPCISLKGDQPHSTVEAAILKKAGNLDQQFVVHSVEEYKAKFHDFTKRIAQGNIRFFDPASVYNNLFEKENDYDYGAAIEWLYQNHKKLKSQKYGAFKPKI
ncbi:MAG: hypothetical protein KTR28_00570 [Micavibrio sp.]|nr:hypothetical protein [Micavibrio sp.]